LIEEILADHPHLTREDILAAHEFAADYLADEEIAFVSLQQAAGYSGEGE